MANEKRLIDANALLEKMQFRLPVVDIASKCISDCVAIARKTVVEAPTVDAVEVVRCKDCVHFQDGYCNHFGYYSYAPEVDKDDYCSHGWRKEKQ